MRSHLVILLVALVSGAAAVRAQSTAAPAAPAGEGTAAKPAPGEEPAPGKEPAARTRIKITIKNSSSFKRSLSVQDDVCHRRVSRARRYAAWARRQFEVCASPEGFGKVTVIRTLTGRKKQFRRVAPNAELRF